jgi:hypothetical protein
LRSNNAVPGWEETKFKSLIFSIARETSEWAKNGAQKPEIKHFCVVGDVIDGRAALMAKPPLRLSNLSSALRRQEKKRTFHEYSINQMAGSSHSTLAVEWPH